MRRPAFTSQQLDDILFPVVERFLLLGEKPSKIALDVETETGVPLTREQIYPLLREAVRRDYLLLCPPLARVLTELLGHFANKGDARVVNVRGDRAGENVSAVGGDVTYELIKQVARERGKGTPVHIGFGIGRSTMLLVRRLAARLRSDVDAPQLTVHAVAPPFSVWHPLETPLAAFADLQDAMPQRVEFVNLSAAPIVQAEDYKKATRHKIVREAFERASEIDIVITSLADHEDEHGHLHEHLTRLDPAGIARLERSGWVGDVQLRPYSKDGPIDVTKGLKPVTIFELADLVELSRRPGKHVVLLCAPCSRCGALKANALLPLLQNSSLHVWSHLVVDSLTAMGLTAGQ